MRDEKNRNQSPFMQLPKDVQRNIALHLPRQYSQLLFSIVSRRTNAIINDPYYQRRRIERDFLMPYDITAEEFFDEDTSEREFNLLYKDLLKAKSPEKHQKHRRILLNYLLIHKKDTSETALKFLPHFNLDELTYYPLVLHTKAEHQLTLDNLYKKKVLPYILNGKKRLNNNRIEDLIYLALLKQTSTLSDLTKDRKYSNLFDSQHAKYGITPRMVITTCCKNDNPLRTVDPRLRIHQQELKNINIFGRAAYLIVYFSTLEKLEKTVQANISVHLNSYRYEINLLSTATLYKHAFCVKTLLSNGADVHSKYEVSRGEIGDYESSTSLDEALHQNDHTNTQLLLEAGASLNKDTPKHVGSDAFKAMLENLDGHNISRKNLIKINSLTHTSYIKIRTDFLSDSQAYLLNFFTAIYTDNHEEISNLGNYSPLQ